MRIAVIGGGISGLGCAWSLRQVHDVVVYEAQPRLGGHSNTVVAHLKDKEIPVDTGFIVYNERNYPNLVQLFALLGVPTHESDMSFGASIDQGRIEYAGSSLRSLYAQPSNLVDLRFQRMVLDILRFHDEGARHLRGPGNGPTTVGDLLESGRYSRAFSQHYLLPMAAAIWSASRDGIRAFPLQSFLRFFANHGLLGLRNRPMWRTVSGGSRVYVERLARLLADRIRTGARVVEVRRQADGIEVRDSSGAVDLFDHVVLACHADEAAALIAPPSVAEAEILGALRYQPNRAVLHTDPTLMPRRRAVWSSWNYIAEASTTDEAKVSVTYWMNRLQGIDPQTLVFVSLNPVREPRPQHMIADFDYAHPQFDGEALRAQGRRQEIQGRDRLWFAGAYWGYGFHEDGLRSGLEVAAALGAAAPWWPAGNAAPGPLVAATPRPLPAAAASG